MNLNFPRSLSCPLPISLCSPHTFCAFCLECFSLLFSQGNSSSSFRSQIALDLLREQLSLSPSLPRSERLFLSQLKLNILQGDYLIRVSFTYHASFCTPKYSKHLEVSFQSILNRTWVSVPTPPFISYSILSK